MNNWLGAKPEKAEDEMTAPPNRAKVVHFSFNSPSASQLLGMKPAGRAAEERRALTSTIPGGDR
jgi:hypothetical protein